MTIRPTVPRATLIAAGLLAIGCSSEPTAPGDPGISSIVLSSPLDSILALGSGVQLAAAVADSKGDLVGTATLDWSSSDPDVLTVAPTGAVSPVAPGTATVTATVASSGISGTLRLMVVDADLPRVVAITGDPIGGAVTDVLSSNEASPARAAWNGCAAAAAQGHIVHLLDCASLVRQQAAAASDPTDRRLLATLSLLADHMERSLGL